MIAAMLNRSLERALKYLFLGFGGEAAARECRGESLGVKRIVHAWWHGGSVYSDKYKSQVKQRDHDIAAEIIMTLVSAGLG